MRSLIFCFLFLVCSVVSSLQIWSDTALANQVQVPLKLPNQQPAQQTMQQPPSPPQLEDIAGPVHIEEQLPWMMIGSGIIIGLIALVILLLIIKKLRKPKHTHIAPSAFALEQLALHKQDFETHKKARTYITEVSETLRHYIEKEFRLQPTSQTTEEFLASISKPSSINEIDPNLYANKDQLKQWFELSDQVKFAHKNISQDELNNMDATVCKFIQSSSSEQNNSAGGA